MDEHNNFQTLKKFRWNGNYEYNKRKKYYFFVGKW
jgi:hypothetical protein